ncbi:unnamed protein product [Echinostoma caproni]|uniref:CA domain-containing protein n=1 Tax=Echinostoma caproni TaxID=27848 RepID=A0A183A5G0_9TREM|nr:unnamed protein product [Echinostoma caproni]
MYKPLSSVRIGSNIISVLCLFGIYMTSILGTHSTPNEGGRTSADRTARSLTHAPALNYEIQEESPRATFVGNVGRDILDLISTSSSGRSGSPTQSDQIDLTITNWRDRAVQLFLLDPASGQLRLASPPDREVLCPASGNSNGNFQPTYLHSSHDSEKATYSNDDYTVIRGQVNPSHPCYVDIKIAYTLRHTKATTSDAVVVDPRTTTNDPGLITVRIRVLDINDHTPVFPQSRVSSELGELSALPEKTVIDLPTAFDPDAGENGTISYWVVERAMSSSSLGRSFETAASNKLDTGSGELDIPFRLAGDPLRLILTRNLDWETKREYDLIVYAKDYGRPQSLTGHLNVHVTVRDENDNVPQFSQNSYMAVINESVLRGTIIMELTASDADSTTNGQVSALKM